LLTRLRLARARHLLTTSSRSVTDICLDVGFSSLGSFTTLFTRSMGLSPLRYRRSVRALVRSPGLYPLQMIPFCFAWAFGGGADSNFREAAREGRR
jgi:hypothetical protein